MRCFYCNKNEAVKSYERVKQGKKREYYCLECYENLFLGVKEGENALESCPYCGTALNEFLSNKLVGCPYCYRTMGAEILPIITKMQNGVCGHRGKTPPLTEKDESEFVQMRFATEAESAAYRAVLERSARFERQKKELELLIKHLKRTGAAREAEYSEKLERMKRTGEVEEEIVW